MSAPKPKKTVPGAAWVVVDSGAHVLRVDGIPLWDVYQNRLVGDSRRWWSAPYCNVGGQHKAGPFATPKEARAHVESHDLPRLRRLLGAFIKASE